MEVGEDDHLMDAELLPIMKDQRARNAKRPPLTTIDPVLMRQRAAAEFVPWNENPQEIHKVHDFKIAAPHHSIPVRLYEPNDDANNGLLIYFHGGGWIIGDLDLEDSALRIISNQSGVKLLSVDYRMAPEHPFPAAIEDGEAVMLWVTENAKSLGIDGNKIAFGGGSAGANVAMGSMLRLRDNGHQIPKLMTLLYGAFSRDEEFESYKKYGNGRFGLPTMAMTFFWNSYLSPNETHPHAIPFTTNLDGIPKCHIIEAELDILSDESSRLAKILKENGTPYIHKIYKGVMHGFTQYHKASKIALEALHDIAEVIKTELGSNAKA
jgi:acetyl esterase